MTHYIHNINPIVLNLPGPLAVRWYGLSYLAGFIGCILLLRCWSKRGEFSVPEKEVSNFVVLLGFFGVFLGGRLGYVLLYGFNDLLADPLYAFKVWDGGMSSHGGFVGVILFMIWYGRKYGHTFWNLADNMACTTSLGFAFGRLANLVNGELWGRVSNVKWAMVFPQELGLGYGEYTAASIGPLVANGDLKSRHPSQLYQAFCEGFLVFGIMLLLRKTALARRPGALSACYLTLYALARIVMEFFREPDNGQFFIGWISKGQFYSLLLILGAGYICWKQKVLGTRAINN
jgi:phosphatidylglycerol:prolipoprotein diacylglycerol transferase